MRRSLVGSVVGRAITGVRAGDFPHVMGDEGIEATTARIVGRTITGVRRRAKYLLLDLDDGTSLVVHLRMTGRLVLTARATTALRFEHLAIELDDGLDLRFADQRKFGRVTHVEPRRVRELQAWLGPEPLTRRFTAAALGLSLSRRPGKLKGVLLDQRLIAGLGNIYADEALFRAGLHPERAARSLTRVEVGRLHRAIRAVLHEALAHRGTTFSSFQDGKGEPGENQHNLRVYGRGGMASCPKCGQRLERTIVAGRGTSFCPQCQA